MLTMRPRIRETLAAYDKLGQLAKRVTGPVDLIDDDTLNENFADVTKVISMCLTPEWRVANPCRSQ